jgi:hypothetical protein
MAHMAPMCSVASDALPRDFGERAPDNFGFVDLTQPARVVLSGNV